MGVHAALWEPTLAHVTSGSTSPISLPCMHTAAHTHLSSSAATAWPVPCCAAACNGDPRSLVTAFTSAPALTRTWGGEGAGSGSCSTAELKAIGCRAHASHRHLGQRSHAREAQQVQRTTARTLIQSAWSPRAAAWSSVPRPPWRSSAHGLPPRASHRSSCFTWPAAGQSERAGGLMSSSGQGWATDGSGSSQTARAAHTQMCCISSRNRQPRACCATRHTRGFARAPLRHSSQGSCSASLELEQPIRHWGALHAARRAACDGAHSAYCLARRQRSGCM